MRQRSLGRLYFYRLSGGAIPDNRPPSTMFCKSCGKRVLEEEREVMVGYNFSNCIECRKQVSGGVILNDKRRNSSNRLSNQDHHRG